MAGAASAPPSVWLAALVSPDSSARSRCRRRAIAGIRRSPHPSTSSTSRTATRSAAWRCRTSRCSPTSTGSGPCSISAAPESRRANARPAARRRSVGGYDLLYPLLDVTTSLDPSFNIAYRFGSIFLAEEYPMGPGRPELADQAARQGLCGEPAQVAVPLRQGVRLFLGAARFEAGGALVQRSREGARVARMDAGHGGIHARARRRPPQLAAAVAADSRFRGTRVRPRQRDVPSASSSTPWTRPSS